MKIIVVDNRDEGDLIVFNEFKNIVLSNKNAVLGFATGSTPLGMYSLMVEDYRKNKTDYSLIKTVNLDEYIGIGKDHKASYYKFMFKTLFNKININRDNVYIPEGLGDPITNALEYDKILKKLGPVDIQLLGIGSNGHIAFNEPGADVNLTTHIVELSDQTILDNARFFKNDYDVPRKAISMGIKSIMKSKKIILMAYGKNKAVAVSKMVNNDLNIPASILNSHDDILLICDKDASALLTS